MFEFVIGRDKLLEKIEDLVERKRYAELRGLLLPLEAVDISDIFADLREHEIPLVFRLLPKEQAAEVFVELDSEQQEMLISTAEEAGLYNNELQDAANDEYMQKMKDAGVEITELTDEQLDMWKEAAQSFYQKGKAFGWSDNLYETVQKAMGK